MYILSLFLVPFVLAIFLFYFNRFFYNNRAILYLVLGIYFGIMVPMLYYQLIFVTKYNIHIYHIFSNSFLQSWVYGNWLLAIEIRIAVLLAFAGFVSIGMHIFIIFYMRFDPDYVFMLGMEALFTGILLFTCVSTDTIVIVWGSYQTFYTLVAFELLCCISFAFCDY